MNEVRNLCCAGKINENKLSELITITLLFDDDGVKNEEKKIFIIDEKFKTYVKEIEKAFDASGWEYFDDFFFEYIDDEKVWEVWENLNYNVVIV